MFIPQVNSREVDQAATSFPFRFSCATDESFHLLSLPRASSMLWVHDLLFDIFFFTIDIYLWMFCFRFLLVLLFCWYFLSFCNFKWFCLSDWYRGVYITISANKLWWSSSYFWYFYNEYLIRAFPCVRKCSRNGFLYLNDSLYIFNVI